MNRLKLTRRDFLKASAATAIALPGCMSGTLDKTTAARPNILFILVDDLGWADVGCFGSKFYETPNIDKLASEGMKFTNAYAACPVCSPTRASIMTGKYPARLDTTDWFGAPQPDTAHKHWTGNKPLLPAHYIEKMALEEVTIAEILNLAGYKTFFAGKWHLGPEGFWPEDQGFDVNKGGWKSGGPYGGGKYFSPYGNPRLKDGPEGEHLPDRLAQETINFIEANKNESFLAHLSFYSVHTPLMSRADMKRKYLKKKKAMKIDSPIWGKEGDRKVRLIQEHAVYAGMVEAMDAAVGKVLSKLKSLGLDQNTVIIFMSDNGGLSTAEGHPTSNLPLRAGKGWLYEGGIREPMIIKWPHITASASVCSEPVTSTDFYPTMLEIAGLPPNPDQHIDGVSLIPLLKGQKLNRGPIYWHYPHYGNQGSSPGSAIRDGDWKLIEWFEDGKLELYNLKNDIGENHNLVDKRPDLVACLYEQLKTWRIDVDAKMPTLNRKK